MDRDQLIKELLVISCFLDDIDSRDIKRISKIVSTLKEYSISELKKYHDAKVKLKEIKINSILGCLEILI